MRHSLALLSLLAALVVASQPASAQFGQFTQGNFSPLSSATWNPADKVNTTLTNGNLTAAQTASGVGGVRGTTSASSGKKFLEVKYVTNPTTGFQVVGLAIGTASLSASSCGFGATVSDAIGIYNGNYYQGNATIGGTAAIPTTGQTLDIAIDIPNHLIWTRVAPNGNWNAGGSANPATGIGGASYTSLSAAAFPCFYEPNIVGTSVTVNFGNTPFVGTMPSGYGTF